MEITFCISRCFLCSDMSCRQRAQEVQAKSSGRPTFREVKGRLHQGRNRIIEASIVLAESVLQLVDHAMATGQDSPVLRVCLLLQRESEYRPSVVLRTFFFANASEQVLHCRHQ